MKKHITMIITAMMAAAVLAGCGTSKEAATTAASSGTAAAAEAGARAEAEARAAAVYIQFQAGGHHLVRRRKVGIISIPVITEAQEHKDLGPKAERQLQLPAKQLLKVKMIDDFHNTVGKDCEYHGPEQAPPQSALHGPEKQPSRKAAAQHKKDTDRSHGAFKGHGLPG